MENLIFSLNVTLPIFFNDRHRLCAQTDPYVE